MSETGIPQLAGLPSNVAGFARAVVTLRDTYAPNVILGYHISVWGTNVDIALSNPSDAMVDTLAARAASFYNSLGANFDIAFGEFSDRDAGFYQYVYGDNGRSWWDAEDFRRNVRFFEWLLCRDAQAHRHVADPARQYQDAGRRTTPTITTRTIGPNGCSTSPRVRTSLRIGMRVSWRFLFGRGAGGPTCACDAARTASPTRRQSTATTSCRSWERVRRRLPATR